LVVQIVAPPIQIVFFVTFARLHKLSLVEFSRIPLSLRKRSMFFARFATLTIILVATLAENGVAQSVETSQSRLTLEDLVASMSIEEKAGQMTQTTVDVILKEESPTEIDPEKLRVAIVDRRVGSILNVKWMAYTVDHWHSLITAIQDAATKETPNKIPVLYGIDSIHGANYVKGSTLFPHNVGVGASRDVALAKAAAKINAAETAAMGVAWNFDPMLGLARQPLWSRFEESYGEDEHLATTLGRAVIETYEAHGRDGKSSPVASCMKHFIGYSMPLTGKDRTTALIPERFLREYLLPPFAAAVKAGASTVMINSGDVNGIPAHTNSHYLKTILRDELGFEGVAVTDWEDIIRLHTRHKVAATPREAVKIAVMAGIDMSMVPFDFSFTDHLIDLVKSGEIPESRLDESVLRILQLKQKLNLFDHPYPNAELKADLGRPEYQQVALDAALHSLTLLKNKDNVLPLPKTAKILLAGPAADNLPAMHGSWSYSWQGRDTGQYPETTLTLAKAMEQAFGEEQVTCIANPDFDHADNADAEALTKAAEGHDYIVLALGENAYAETPGGIDDLMLEYDQIKLIVAAKETGKKVVVVMMSGRPRVIGWAEDQTDAFLMAYRPASKGGEAICQVLNGEFNPCGKLPFTWPRGTGDVVMYDHGHTSKINEPFPPGPTTTDAFNPQWPFGAGLSYSQFSYSNLKADRETFSGDDQVTINIDITNSDEMAGWHVVELYSRDLFASVVPCQRRLRMFKKIHLNAGETKPVEFKIDAADLSFIDRNMKRITEPGGFLIMIGDKQLEIEFQ
jgi:beta-glucosidase